MKKRTRFLTLFLLSLLVTLMLPTTVFANAAEPPSIIIIVPNAPDDLTLTLVVGDHSEEAIKLPSEDKVVERYYRIYSGDFKNQKGEDGTLVVECEQYQFELSMSGVQPEGYANVLTLDLDDQTLAEGEAPFRTAFYVAARVIVTLIIEGAIFYAFGFREKQSWISFLILNLVTQGGLNLMLTGPDLGRIYWEIELMMLEIVVLITELIVLPACVKEKKGGTTRLFVGIANLASLFAGGYFIANLPV